jgi:chitosanase
MERLCNEGSGDTSGLPEADYIAAWTEAADDPAFRDAQDAVITDFYFNPAMERADELGIERPLTRLALYDLAWLQSGTGADDFVGIIDRTNESVGTPPEEVDEITWLYELLRIRRDVLEGAGDEHPNWVDTVHRVECLLQLADEERYDLDEPVTCNAFDGEFTTD